MSELKAILATPHPKMKNACDGAIEVYPKDEADTVIAELEETHKKEVGQLLIEIVELKVQKAQAARDCAYWKTKAQKNAADNAVDAKQRAEAIKHYIELADKFNEAK